MASNGQQDSRNPSTPPQSIPLRDLTRPPDVEHGGQGNTRGRSLLSGGSRPTSSTSYGTRYERLEDVSPSPTEREYLHTIMAPPRIQEPIEEEQESPIENPAAFQAAMGFEGFAGIEVGSSSIPRPTTPGTIESEMRDPDLISPYAHPFSDSNDTYFQHIDSDRIPLTDPNYLQPMSGAQNDSSSGQPHDRSSFQSVRFSAPDTTSPVSRLGDDLPGIEAQYGNWHSRGNSYGNTLSPIDRRTSHSQSSAESPLSRAGSIMRAMSQRVVNLSNEPEPPEMVFRRKASVSDELTSRGPHVTSIPNVDTSYQSERFPVPAEKEPPKTFEQPAPTQKPWPATNPFRGKSLGLFSPDNRLRIWLCDFLVNPVTEIAILVLIMAQTVLLAVDSSTDGHTNPHYQPWGANNIDYVIIALFAIFTLEVIIRIIVSGFFFNPAEYSTIHEHKGIRAALATSYKRYLGPQRQTSVRRPRGVDPNPFSASFARTFTAIQSNNPEPTSAEEQQRQQLARRAFLRHSLNRIDFIAVVSFWISLILSITGAEGERHLYVFRMLSCLRILRLLYLTHGTTVSKRLLHTGLTLTYDLDYSEELKEGCSATCPSILSDRLLLAPFRNYRSPGVQVKLKSPVRLDRSPEYLQLYE
jgi:voltage-dependent calcium channel